MARSFVFKFLSHAIRQPRIVLEADSRRFSFVILVEGQLPTTYLEKEIRWRLRINIESLGRRSCPALARVSDLLPAKSSR
jgi:hypothetical protein